MEWNKKEECPIPKSESELKKIATMTWIGLTALILPKQIPWINPRLIWKTCPSCPLTLATFLEV